MLEGVTSYLEMPNTKPLTTTQAALDQKLALAAEKSLVNYGFFIGATEENLPDLREANPTCGIKIFMGSMKGPLLVDDEAALDAIFSEGDRLIAVHAEDRTRIEQRRQQFAGITDPAVHSQIQDNEAALIATKRPYGSRKPIAAAYIFCICPLERKRSYCVRTNPTG